MDIYHKEPQGGPFIDGSYSVYSIRKVDNQEPFWKIDQKIAKLLSELDGKGNSSRPPLTSLEILWKVTLHLEKYKDITSFKIKGRDGRWKKQNYLINLQRIQLSSLILQLLLNRETNV